MEWQLWEGDPPEWTTPEWYAERETAPHLEQGLHRGRLFTAAAFVRTARQMGYGPNVVDLGAGDGGLLSLVQHDEWAESTTQWGYDLQQTNIDAARINRDVDVAIADVVACPECIMWGDIAVATEMLEHLVDPHGFVRKIAEHSRVLVASSPFTETGDSHYEFHTWAWDQDGYRELLEQAGYKVVRQQTIDMFQVVLGIHR
jgi:2-polyprenyl-3-methyl-5-hydroxy-6-metoxy-1,4-benzoquinol methylase